MRLRLLPTRVLGGFGHSENPSTITGDLVAGPARKVYSLSTMTTSRLSPKDIKGLLFIRDTVRYRGQSPTLQMIAAHMGFKSRRSSALLIQRLAEVGFVDRTPGGNLRMLKEPAEAQQSERTIAVPLVGAAPCGIPMLAEENVEALISISQRIARPGASYFLLRAIGTSMNLAGIQDGDLVLVRQQPVAENGDRVVALIDDSATIKVLHRFEDKVVLKPQSSDTSHQPIMLDRDFLIQGVVIDTIPA